MKVTLYTSTYKIIDHGIVFLFKEDGDLTFEIDTGNFFSFKLILTFISKENEPQIINRTIKSNVITMECINFLSSGTGTSIPIELATIHGKRIYISFWTYLEGDVSGKDKSRSVKYTIFSER